VWARARLRRERGFEGGIGESDEFDEGGSGDGDSEAIGMEDQCSSESLLMVSFRSVGCSAVRVGSLWCCLDRLMLIRMTAHVNASEV
jgi:hypothetical protein